MPHVDVELPDRTGARYRIEVGTRLPVEVADGLVELADPPLWAVICDDIVAPLYGRALARALESSGAAALCLSFPEGEDSKTRETVGRLQDDLIARGFRRDGWVVAVGGGVVGDVAGFVAATLFRGVPYVQIPTTLLAMVDSSVGGKTGVDTAAGKNLVGAFWQPRRVYVDVTTLDSLPPREMAAGLAEVIKYGIILDADLFSRLEGDLLEACLRHAQEDLEEVATRCCRLKAEVVVADETESDYRQILNFGHTVAHALEAVRGFELRHGEAVAIGMVAEARLASRLVGAPDDLAERVAAVCRRAGLPTAIPADCDVGQMVAAASRDKKARRGRIRCALPEETGRMHRGTDGWAVDVAPELLAEVLSR